jgi:hypothetical protein
MLIRIWHFDDVYHYKGFVLVNEIHEDEDVRKNSWMFAHPCGENDQFVDTNDLQQLTGLSSNSYAPFEEVMKNFQNRIDNLLPENNFD